MTEAQRQDDHVIRNHRHAADFAALLAACKEHAVCVQNTLRGNGEGINNLNMTFADFAEGINGHVKPVIGELLPGLLEARVLCINGGFNKLKQASLIMHQRGEEMSSYLSPLAGDRPAEGNEVQVEKTRCR